MPLPSRSQPEPLQSVRERGPNQTLALAVVRTIRRGEFIFLDRGEVSLEIVRFLPGDAEISAVSNSPAIIQALIERGDVPAVMVGGTVDLRLGACVDAIAVQTLATMRIDRCVITEGTSCFRSALWVEDHGEAVFKRSLLKLSRKRQVAANAASFRMRGTHQIGGPSEIDEVIASYDLSEAQNEALQTAGFHVTTTTAAPKTPVVRIALQDKASFSPSKSG